MGTWIFLALIVGLVFYYFRKRQTRGSKHRVRIPKGMPQEQVEKLYDEMIERVASGELAGQLVSNVLLKKGETLLLEIPGIQLCEERAVKVGGGYHGFSVRIAKGLSYRFGEFAGGIERKVVPIDTGTFTLTNKRFTFAGTKRSVECLLPNIISIDPMQDGIAVSRKGTAKTEYYVGTDVVRVWATLKADTGEGPSADKIEWVLTGEEVRRLIQRLVREG